MSIDERSSSFALASMACTTTRLIPGVSGTAGASQVEVPESHTAAVPWTRTDCVPAVVTWTSRSTESVVEWG